MRISPPAHIVRDPGTPLGYDMSDFARRMDAENGSRALLERQVRYHQYPCKILVE